MPQLFQFKRGLALNLPAEAEVGEPLITLDTKELYIGLGEGQPPFKIGGSGLYRYDAGNGCYVLATGLGVTVTKSGTPNTNLATINVPVGIHVLSASIHFTATDATSAATTYLMIDFSSNSGTGGADTYPELFAPQFQVWIDDTPAGTPTYAYKPGVTADFTLNPHTMRFKALTNGQSLWVNISF